MDHQEHTEQFFQKYANYIYNDDQFVLPPITGAQLMERCHIDGSSAASLDGWENSEFFLLPLSALNLLADFLNKVETLGKWPEILCRQNNLPLQSRP